jgi:hypothetical protein
VDVDDKGVARPRVECPTGCRATVAFERGLGASSVEVRRGGSKAVGVILRDPDKIFAGKNEVRLGVTVTVRRPDQTKVVTARRVVTLTRR